jgi:hypothetical protein
METPTTRGGDPDELAIQRYRYLLRTAPPEALEAAHREAFEQLSPEQRRRVLEGLATQVDPSELRQADETPAGLARLATRAELRQPGTMERAFAGGGAAGGFGGSFLGMLAGAFIGTSIANAMFAGDSTGAADAGAADSGSTDGGDGGVSGEGGNVEGGDWGDGDDPGFDGGDGGFDGGGFDGGGFDLGF